MSAIITPRETGILMKGPLVIKTMRDEKTQTRRPVTGREALKWLEPGMFEPSFVAHPDNFLCPYGYAGDRLYVKETLRLTDQGEWSYAADGAQLVPPFERLQSGDYAKLAGKANRSTRVSIHMPRWASRLTLEITELRVQRVQDLSEEDARAEGCPGDLPVAETLYDYGNGYMSARARFRTLWDSINSKRGLGWDANPWCWCITYRRV